MFLLAFQRLKGFDGMFSNCTLVVATSTLLSNYQNYQKYVERFVSDNDNVGMLVVYQDAEEDSIEFLGDRIVLIYQTGRGISRSRNAVLSYVGGLPEKPFVLISDDDINHHQVGIAKFIEYSQSKSADIYTVESVFPGNERWKRYPLADKQLGYRNCFRVASFEIVLSPGFFDGTYKCFDKRFGIGSNQFGSAEENIFLVDNLRLGKKIIHSGVLVNTHPVMDFTKYLNGNMQLRSKGAMLRRMFGVTGLFVVPVFAWRIRKKASGRFVTIVIRLYQGWLDLNAIR